MDQRGGRDLVAIDALIPYLDLQSLLSLRNSCSRYRRHIDAARVLKHAHLPCLPRKDTQYTFNKLQWFLYLPPPQEAILGFPLFRVRGALARLHQGALRIIQAVRVNGRLHLEARVQQSVAWQGGGHVVVFVVENDFLAFKSCRCRDG